MSSKSAKSRNNGETVHPTTISVTGSLVTLLQSTGRHSDCTTVTTSTGIFVPGYLLLKELVDYRIDALIARGGCGTIHLGKLFKGNNATSTDMVIIKRAAINSPAHNREGFQCFGIAASVNSCVKLSMAVFFCSSCTAVALFLNCRVDILGPQPVTCWQDPVLTRVACLH